MGVIVLVKCSPGKEEGNCLIGYMATCKIVVNDTMVDKWTLYIREGSQSKNGQCFMSPHKVPI